MFYAQGRWWAFYAKNETMICYASSTDGVTWDVVDEVVDINTNDQVPDYGRFRGDDFSVATNGTHVAYVGHKYYTSGDQVDSIWDSKKLRYRLGVLSSSGTITWYNLATVTVVDVGSITAQFYPYVEFDANDYVWVGYRYTNESVTSDVYVYYPRVIKNDAKDGTWSTASGFPIQLSSINDTSWRVMLAPLDNGDMYIIYGRKYQYGMTSGSLYGRLYTTSLGSEENIEYGYLLQNEGSFSVVTLGNNVHLAWAGRTGSGSLYLVHRKRDYTDGWQSPNWVESAFTEYPAISADETTENLYVFYLDASNNRIYYYHWDGSSWSSLQILYEESVELTGVDRFSVASYSGDNKILITYMTGTSAPYEIRAILKSMNNPPNAPTLDNPSADARFDISESVTFSWTFNDPDGDSQGAYQFQLDDNSDFSSPIIDTGKVSSSSTNTTQTLPSTIGLYYWRVKTWDNQGAEGSWSTSRTIIVDRVQITLTVADNRIDVGSTMSWSFTAVYEYDNSNATSYVSVNLNDTITKNSVGIWYFTVHSITESQYGLSVFTSNVISCIWDKVLFTLSVDDNRIDIGATASISVSGVYAYDNSAFSGSYTLNDTLTKNSVGKYYYAVDSMSDSNYGLTVFESNIVYVIFDRVVITLSVSDNRINVGDNATININAVYDYDGSSFVGSITLNDTQTIKNNVGIYWFTVSSMTDNQYGLTVFTSNTIYVIYDRIDADNFEFSDTSMFNVSFRCFSEYDGLLTDKNFQVKLYINNTLQHTYSVSSNSSGYITLTSTTNLHGEGNISFYIIWTDENIKSYEKTKYVFNYAVHASIYDDTIDLLSSYTPTKKIELEVTFLPNCTIYNASNILQKWTLKLKNLYWKAYIYEATKPPKLYTQTPYSPSSWVFTSDVSGALDIWSGYMYPPYKSGSYFIELELWIKGSDCFLDSINSTIFSVEVTTGVSGSSSSSEIPSQETLTLFIKVLDYYNKEIKGASIQIKDIYNKTIYNATTDMWGTATITLSPGNYTIIVSYNNVTEVKHLEINETQHLEFKLKTLAVTPTVREVVIETQTLIFIIIATVSVILAVYFERRKQYYLAVPIAGLTMFSIFYTLAVSLRLVKPFIMFPNFNISLPKISLPSFMHNISILENTTLILVFSFLIVIFGAVTLIYKHHASKHRKRRVKKVYRHRSLTV